MGNQHSSIGNQDSWIGNPDSSKQEIRVLPLKGLQGMLQNDEFCVKHDEFGI